MRIVATLSVLLIAASVATAQAGEPKEKKVKLSDCPQAVQKALEREVGDGRIVDIGMMREGDATVYEAEVRIDGQEFDIKVRADGKLLARVREGKEEGDEEMRGKEKGSREEGRRAKRDKEDDDGETAKGDKDDDDEGDEAKDDKEDHDEDRDEMKGDKEDDDEDEEGDDEEDEDSDEEEEEDDGEQDEEQPVQLADLPKAVLRTLKEESRGGKVEEISKEKEGSKVVFEAEVVIGGKEYEVEVAADGTLLSKVLDDEEEDDADDNAEDDDDGDDGKDAAGKMKKSDGGKRAKSGKGVDDDEDEDEDDE